MTGVSLRGGYRLREEVRGRQRRLFENTFMQMQLVIRAAAIAELPCVYVFFTFGAVEGRALRCSTQL